LPPTRMAALPERHRSPLRGRGARSAPPALRSPVPAQDAPKTSSETPRARLRDPSRSALTRPSNAKEPMDRTLILVKPDAFARSLTGEIIARFERKGLRIVALRQLTMERELAERHYAEHAERPFFGELVEFIISGPLVAMVLEGLDAVRAARQVIGATNPLEAAPGSIRGDFAIETGQNLVHGSDSPESAAREAALFFGELS
jgi:nucleoside-diphosphate kinase